MDRKTQTFLIGGFVILVILITVAAAIFSGSAPSNGQTGFVNAPEAAALTAADHTKGPANAKVTVIEYGDYECPACGAYQPIVQQLESAYSDRVLFVFRNFPLYQIHQDAMISADAAEAAALQGKFWEMHDLLYQTQNDWTQVGPDKVVSQFFDGYARQLGLNVQKFDADISSDAVKQRVQRDLDMANAEQLNHTPTFFVNLKQIENPTSYQQFASILDAALTNAGAATSSSK